MTYEEARKIIQDWQDNLPGDGENWGIAEAAAIMMSEVDRYTQLPASVLEEELCQTRCNLDEAHLIIEKKTEHIKDLCQLIRRLTDVGGVLTLAQRKLYDKIKMENYES